MTRARTLLTSASTIPVVGLLVLVGNFSGTPHALAQAQGDCGLPAGTTPPEGPHVTAQQVEDGSASLMEFALAARDRYYAVLHGEFHDSPWLPLYL